MTNNLKAIRISFIHITAILLSAVLVLVLIATNSSQYAASQQRIQQQQILSTLKIINHVNNSAGGNVQSPDFAMIITDLNLTKSITHKVVQVTDFVNGSETGIALPVLPGFFEVTDNHRPGLSKPLTMGYNATYSGDCKAIHTRFNTIAGVGIVRAGGTSTCHITRTLIQNR